MRHAHSYDVLSVLVLVQGGKGPSLWTGDEVKRKLYLYLALCSKVGDVLVSMAVLRE